MGLKLRYGRPCQHNSPGPITGLHNSTLLPFSQSSTDHLMLAQSWKFGVNCCSIGLTHPAACTGALVPLTFGHVNNPPFTQFAQKGWQSTGLELRILMVYLKSVEVAQKKTGDPSPQIKLHRRTTPPHPLSDSTYTYTNR